MSDDLTQKGSPDSKLISTSERWELDYWTKALGCSETELLQAVDKVGNSAEAVRKYLRA